MLKQKFSFKKIYLICFIMVCLFVGLELFLQNQYMVLPCVLSHIERIILFFLGIIFLIIILFNHTIFSRKVWSSYFRRFFNATESRN